MTVLFVFELNKWNFSRHFFTWFDAAVFVVREALLYESDEFEMGEERGEVVA